MADPAGAAPAADSSKPEFVLDKLKHVEPLPGPIWLDRFFFPFFGDSHAENTELLGMDQKKGGDLGALLAVLTHVVENIRSERKEELRRIGVTEAQERALDKVIQILKGGIALGNMLTKINTPEQFATFLFQFKSALRNMAPTEKILVGGGWRSMEGGHCVMHFIERHENSYSFTVHNTGKGVEYHPSTVTSHPKTKYQTSLKFTNITQEKILDDAVWYMYWKMQVSTSDDHRCEILYDVILPHLLDCTLGVAIAKQQAADPQAASLCEFRTAQRAEVNYLKSMKEALRYILREEGWTAAHTKHFSFLMRRQILDMVALDLNQLPSISEADAKLLRVACQKLARAATKESETINPKRLEADGLEEVFAQLQWIESQISSKLAAREPIPQLTMTMKATFEPFPNFQLFRRLAPVEQFAGWKKDRPGNDLIDFLAIPARPSEIRHFGDVLKSLMTCHSLCERLSMKSSSAAYFHRIALIQDYFTQILPRPLPPFRSRKVRMDAAGKPLPVRECIYASAIIDYATQLQCLNLILELAKHYIASAKSVSTNRAFEGSHAIVMSTIVAVADAVLRIPACDTTSVVTMVLNGTEARFKPKTKNFASPYEGMSRGHRGMQQSIQSFQQQLGLFGAPIPPAAAAASSSSSSSSSAPKPAINRSNLPTIEVIVPSPGATASASSSTSVAATTTSTAAASSSTPAASTTTTAASVTTATAVAATTTTPAPATTAASIAAALSSTPAATAAPLDAETQAKVAEAQRLLTEALASFAKAKASEAAQMATAAQTVVTPLFFTSLQNGRGVEFVEMSEKIILTQPNLAVARGEVLEYFQSQTEVATKAIFNFPTRMNCSTYFGKDGPTLELIKNLCQILGYDLNPDGDPNDKNQSMDDQVSFIEAATWYMTNEKSPFKENQPELFVYRDIVALYHIMIAQTDHRRSIKVRRWTPNDVALKWRIKEVNRAKTMIDINLELMGEEAVCLDSLPIYSAADASSYITDVALVSEDDVLHALNLPSFNDILSEEDSEMLISYLTAPYIRIPLVISFFSTKDRVAVLLNRDVQNMIESVLFEPRQWVTEYDPPLIQQIPAASRSQIGASRGMLLNEIMHNPQVLLSSLLTMAKLTLDLNTGDYTSSSREIILYVIRLMVRVESHIVYVLDNLSDVFRHTAQPSAAYLRQLKLSRDELRSYFLGPVRSALIEWEAAASEENDLISCCVFHAHLALLYRGVRSSEWTAESVAHVLQHSAFLRTWYSAGLTADAMNEGGDQVGDNFYQSNSLGMGTRFGMMRGGMMMGGRGGGMIGRLMGGGRFGGGRGLGDDAEDEPSHDGSASSGRRRGRGGRNRLLKPGEEKDADEKKKDDEKEKKKKSESDDEEDDMVLPGLGEEVAIEKLKEKNPGEGKASDLPVLEVPDQELFEALQYIRRGYVTWLSTANANHVDDVLQGCLAASTRSPGVVSRGWTLISTTPGLWRSQNSDLEVNVQTAELFFKHSTIEPVPNAIAQTQDYTLLFGLKPLHCALVAMHDHRSWFRMVGSAFSLKRWERVEPELVVVNQPVPLPTPVNVPAVTWVCFNDGNENPFSAESCVKCNKRERPKFPHGFKFEEESYGRMYVPTAKQMAPHEKWIFDAVEPVLGALFGGRTKMAWELWLPTQMTDANALTVHLLGRDEMRTFREVIVHRERGVAQIYSLLEHGRRIYRSLEYTSDSRFTFRYVEPLVKDRAFPWAPEVRHGAGRLLPAFWDASLVITRDRTDEYGNVSEETFVPSRFLYGLIPSALLDHFFFWQRPDETFVAYPRSRTEPAWFYKLHVRLIQSNSPSGAPLMSAIITRHKLDPDTIDREDPRASDTDGASSFEIKKQLTADDPLLVAINASKIATLREMGYTDAISTEILKRFDYDLAIAQSWLADPTNTTELEAMKAADPDTLKAINAASASSSSSSSSFSLADAPSAKHQLLLLNLLHAAPDSMLYRLGNVLSRIEDLSYILCWTTSAVSSVGGDVSITLIELPRLKLKLQPRVYVNEKGEESIRLYSLDHSNMFVSDYRDDMLNKLLDGLSHTLLFENNEHELFVLAPNYIMWRPNITSEPFSAELVPERGAASWMAAQESRFFLYPVHNSHTFLLTPTQSSAVYLILLRLLGRQYTEAFSVVQSCEADRKLSESEEWVLQQLAQAATDFHPNAAAIRLKLSLVIMHSGCPFPWRVQDEYKQYLEKLNLVSAVCRLSIDEEIYLLKHLRSGAEFEDMEEMEDDNNELDAKPRHLDTALANRLSFLSSMIADEEEYAQTSASLKLDASTRDVVPHLTRTRSGRKQCYLLRPLQKGCKNLWSEVETAVDRYYADFSFNSRTWDAQIEYARPDQAATLLGPAIKTLNGVWKDTITGLGRKLGFFFLTDLLTRQVDICLTDPGQSSSASLGKLFGRLLLLKSTAWGVRWDLAVHRSYRERSFVPFVILALLERLPVSVAKNAPKLPFLHNRQEFVNGCSVSNKGQDGPEMSAGGKYLETLSQFTQQFVRMPERLNDARLKAHAVEQSESIIVPPIHSLLTAPQPTDFACNQRRIQPFEHESVTLTEADCRSFSDQLLSSIDLNKYVRLCPSSDRVADEVSFDVETHADAQTHVAKALLKRMHDDVKVYARQVNEGTIPKVACLLDETLAKFTDAPAMDATVNANIQESIRILNELVVDLENLATQDKTQIPLTVSTVLDLANQVESLDEDEVVDDAAMADVGIDTQLHRMQFMMSRYSELKPSITLDYLCGCLLSSQLIDDLRAVNPFLPKGSEVTILNIVQAFLLRVSRLGHIYRCTSMSVELIGLLRGIAHLSKTGEEGKIERSVYLKALTFKASALATALVTRRFAFGPGAFVVRPSDDGVAVSSANSAASATPLDYEPRYVLFEYLFNILLRNQQVKLLHTFLTSKSQVQQMIMGAGKTTVIGPLLALILADGTRLVTQVVPSALLEFSRSVMRSRFTQIICKRIHTFSFDRSVKKIRHITRLFDKLDAARKTKGIVMTSPESIKALFLKHVELLHQLESAPSNLSAPAQLRLKIRSEMADQLSNILQLWRKGDLILDEVDLLLHPLRSELNFPILEKQPLDLSPDRWELPIHLLDSIFYAMYRTMSVAFGQSDHAFAVLDSIRLVIEEGVRLHAIQSSPHLVLLDADFYHAKMKVPLAQWVLCWLKSKQHLNVRLTDESAIEYIVKGPLESSPETITKVKELHNAIQRKVLHLAHDWLSSFMPHVLAKINRVSFGLLTAEDMSLVDPNMPNSRKLMAVPFVGKDVPSHASEFAHPDILIGLTVLSYRYEGMRRSDVRRVIGALQRQMRNQVGPYSMRPASITFDSWCEKGKVFAQLLHTKQQNDQEAEARAALKKSSSSEVDESKMSDVDNSSSSSSSSSTVVVPTRRKLKLTPIVPLSIFQLSDKQQMRALFQRVRHLPDLIHFYLEKQVFPAVMQFQTTKLSASGSELGGSLLFDLRYGFSGTPSDLLPLELGSCGYELGSEGNILTTMTNPSIVSAEIKGEWSVRGLLSEVAHSNAHALIDTGALITGFTNLEVARYLLENGLEGLEGCVFLDRLDRQMILLRASFTVIPLATCGIDPSKRFTFYDQVHTTGIDIRQSLNAIAVVTLGKDMTFRDYAQGAFRMRGIGKGQTISLYIIPEVMKLIDAETTPTKRPNQTLISSVAAWLTVNSMRSERLQFMQLCSQNMKNVWRKRAYEMMLLETTRNDEEPVDERRFWRFQEVHSSDILFVRRCINTFREPIDFDIPADITEAKTFAKLLSEELANNRDLIVGDVRALDEIKKIEALASGASGSSTELQQRSLNQEMVNEQEQEQEQKKTVEQEEQSQVRFSREDEQQRSWKIFELTKFIQPTAATPINSLSRAPSTAVGLSLAASSSSSLSAASLSLTSATVKDTHPFYEFNRFSVRGVNERDIDMPEHILLSSNYYRAEWAAMGQRRLKNVNIVLEWSPQAKYLQAATPTASTPTAAASSSSSSALSPFDMSQPIMSQLLSDAQEGQLQTAWKMFADDSGKLMTVTQLKLMMREVGEDLSADDFSSLSQSSNQQLTYDQFRQFILSRSVNRTHTQGRRFFVCVSLKEAESLRRLIHCSHPLFAVNPDPLHQVSIGLRLLNGSLLDSSPAFTPVASGVQALALQTLRFVNCEFFFNDAQLSLLLKSLQHNRSVRRQAFFENLLRCRRRDRRRWNDTPLSTLFLLADEHSLLSYRAKVARVRFCLRSLSLSLQDAFNKFDCLGDGFLSTTELAFALIEYLQLPLTMADINQLMEFANQKNDGLLSIEEFNELLREPEIVSQTSKAANDSIEEANRAQRLKAIADESHMDVDEASASPPPVASPLMKRNVSYTRLTLSPEYERLYIEEENLRRARALALEKEIEMAKAEKIAREIERKEIEESQARDWKQIQELRKLNAMDELWTCPACTFKNEPTAHFCVVCEGKKPEQTADRPAANDIRNMEDTGDGRDGPAFWVCGVCSYNNDQTATVCEMCNAAKPKVQRAQKKLVTLWSCPLCTRLVTSDKEVCDVCTSDKDAIRTAAPAAATTSKDFASLLGSSLISKNGVPYHVSELTGKCVLLYFSAHWCAPCRAFTPQLASIYNGAVSAQLPVEIVFVSDDHDVEAFNSYFASMPWRAIKYSDEATRKRLKSQFEVRGIPTLVVLDSQGNVLTMNGTNVVRQNGDVAIAQWCQASTAAAEEAAKAQQQQQQQQPPQ